MIKKDILFELVKSLKEDANLNNIRFVKAYNGQQKESPLEDILVTVTTGKSESTGFIGGYIGNSEKGKEINSEIILNVYCPCEKGGDGITDTVNTIVERISKTDIDSLVKDIQVSEIKLNSEYEAVYRTIKLSMRYISLGGDSVE